MVGRLPAPEQLRDVLPANAGFLYMNSSYELIDNQAVSIAQTPGPRKPNYDVATIVLAALHGALVPLTLLLSVAFLIFSLDDPHGECRIHGLNCDRGAHMREAALIGVLGSAALIILEFLLMTPLLRKRRLPFVVPLLCCIGQFIILGAVFSSGNAAG